MHSAQKVSRYFAAICPSGSLVPTVHRPEAPPSAISKGFELQPRLCVAWAQAASSSEVIPTEEDKLPSLQQATRK